MKHPKESSDTEIKFVLTYSTSRSRCFAQFRNQQCLALGLPMGCSR